MWQVAEAAGHASPDRLQDFLARASWDADELRDRVREFVVDSLRAEDAVLIADETGDIKKGVKSAGVARQYTGVTGQVENAQVSVHLSYGSSRGRAIIDRELYAGQHWAGRGAERRRRCEEAGVPEERARTVVTKPELARRMVERALTAQGPGVLAKCRFHPTGATTRSSVSPLATAVPGPTALANRIKTNRENAGALGIPPQHSQDDRWRAGCLENGHVRFGGRPHGKGPVHRQEPRRVAHPAQAAKNEVGFGQHEVRKWISWYRQTTVCMLALAFLADVRSRRIRPYHPTP